VVKSTNLHLLPLAVILLASASCNLLANLPAELQPVNLSPPKVTFQGAALVLAPSQAQLAAYYCPEVISVPLGGAGVVCQGLFGRRPSPAEMTVAFDLHFGVANPNKIPVPLASILTAATLFPAGNSQRLGAVCAQLCPAGQPGCGGGPAPGACQSSSRDVHSLSDFAGAAANFLFASGVAAAAGHPIGFAAPQVSASSELNVTVRFTFGPQVLLATMRQLAVQSVNHLKAGHTVSFAIPYRLEGTVWFDVGSLGRIAVGFGPSNGVWVLPVQHLSGL
jgi:hypothetical protein